MKVLNVISQYPGKTGSGTYLQALIKEGKKHKNIQGLVAAIPFGEAYENKYVDKLYPIHFNTEILPFPIVGMSDVMPYESTRYSDLSEDELERWGKAFRDAIIRAIDDFKPDVIVSHHLWLLTSFVVDIVKDIKIIGICHGTDIRQLINNPQYKHGVIENIKKLDCIISLSNTQRKEIAKYYKVPFDKIKVVGAGFEQDIFYRMERKTNKDQPIRLIYVGKLSYQKGLVSLIRVFKKIKSQYSLTLTIVGAGFGKEEAYIKEIGKDRDIFLEGMFLKKP